MSGANLENSPPGILSFRLRGGAYRRRNEGMGTFASLSDAKAISTLPAGSLSEWVSEDLT
jgi:hypothetical protein